MCGLGHAKVLAPVSKLDLGIGWPVSILIDLEEPGLPYDPSCAQAGVQFGSQLHGFKPGDAVKKPWEIKFLVWDFWNGGAGFCPLFSMVLHGQGQAKRQVCRWSRAFVA